MPVIQDHAQRALEHIAHLAGSIGPRPSARAGERQAAEYASDVLMLAGLRPRIETFGCGRSTYDPYALAFATGLLGAAIYIAAFNQAGALIAAALNALGAWMFFRETELQSHLGRRLLPQGTSQNVLSVSKPAGEAAPRRRVVVYGHLDTHRTPIFYSSPAWVRAFAWLVGASFAGLLVNMVMFLIGFAVDQSPWPPLGVLTTAALLFGFIMCVHAELTPFSPGANDNASGCATALTLGERLGHEPLDRTEVWIVANGCEENGAYGIGAFLDAHGDELRDAYFISLDMVGIGAPMLLLREGLLLPSRPDDELLRLARETARAHPGLLGGEHRGGAYTDTGLVARRGYRGLTIDAITPPGHPSAAAMGHWHRMSDTPEHIELDSLRRAHDFVWALLKRIDAS